MPAIRVYADKQIRVEHFTIDQREMLRLGNVGLAARKEEISRAQNARGGSAKPLRRGYAIFKARYTKLREGRGRNKRDLNLTGQLMKGWLVRTVSNNRASASWSTRRNRRVAQGNNVKEEFISWSQANERRVVAVAEGIAVRRIPDLVRQYSVRQGGG